MTWLKAAIFYYSFSGKTEKIAREIEKILARKSTSVDLFRIEYSKHRFVLFKLLDVIFMKNVEISPEKINISDYDFIIAGSPIWVGNFTPPFKTFLRKLCNLNGKKFFLYITQRGTNITKLMKDTVESIRNKGAEMIGIETFTLKQEVSEVDLATLDAILGKVAG